jgi:hypothetical protein
MPYAERRARMRPRPFALEPLAEALGVHLRQVSGADGDNLTGTLAGLLGVGERTVKRMRQQGLSLRTADRYATRFRIHPVQLWPEAWGLHEPEPGEPPAPEWMVRP